MDNIFTHKRSLLAQIAFHASYGANFLLVVALPIEIFSSIQVVYVILATGFPSSDDAKAIIFDNIRDGASFIGLFDSFTTFKTESFTLLVWLAMSIYILVYAGLAIWISVLCFKGSEVCARLSALFTRMNVMHSKVFCCPIYYFYLKVVISREQCDQSNSSSLLCHPVMFVLTLVLTSINVLLAILKEAYFYQVYKNQNACAVQNNLHSLFQLMHKIILLPLLVLTNINTILTSLLNLGFTSLCLVLLLIKLPYYNLRCMRTVTVLFTLCATSSLVLVWRILSTSHARLFELLLSLVNPAFVKIVMGVLDSIFERILTLGSNSPEQIIHLPNLIKEYMFKPTGVDFNETFKYNELYGYGFMKRRELSISATNDPSQLKNCKVQVNAIILAELLKCYKKNPKSPTTLLFLIQFYTEKMKNVSKGIVFLQKMKELLLPTSTVTALFQIKIQLEQMLYKAYSKHDPSLEFISYFKYKELSTVLKNTIEDEVKEHIKFWKSLSKDKVDVNQILEASFVLDSFSLKIQDLWEKNGSDFIKNFPVPLILYGAYLSVVRGTPHLAQRLLSNSAGKNSKLMKSMEKWFSQEKASIVVSNQKGTIGKVLDASHSVKNLFNINKQDLIGRKINLLMPSMMQEKHDAIIERYNEKPKYALTLQKTLYCRTVDGNFFKATLDLRVYPYIDQGIGIIGILTKKEECVPIFFIDAKGYIVDSSRDIPFRMNFSLTTNIKIEEIAPEFDRINTAFNMIHSPSIILPQNATAKAEDGLKAWSPTEITQRGLLSETSALTKEDIPFTTQRLLSERRDFKLDLKQITKEPKSPAHVLSEPNIDEDISESGFTKPADEQIVPSIRSNNAVSAFLSNLKDRTSSPFIEKIQLADEDVLDIKRARDICQQYTNGNFLRFHFQETKQTLSASLQYFVKIEPYIFEQQLYKIVRVEQVQRRKKTRDEIRTPKWMLQSKKESQLDLSGVETLKRRKTKNWDNIEKVTYSEGASSVTKKTFGEVMLGDGESISVQTSDANDSEEGVKQEFKKGNKRSNSNHNKAERIEKTFYNLFKKKTPSVLTRVYTIVFYMAILLTILLAVLDYVKTKASFDDIELGIKLVDADSERLIALVQVWGVANVLYTYVKRNQPIPYALDFIDYLDGKAESVKQESSQLMTLLGSIESQAIISEFYRKDIHFWDVTPNRALDSVTFDVFTASNIILEKLLVFSGNDSEIAANLDVAIFGLNNTINDLLLSAERELGVTQQAQADIFEKNSVILKALIIVQSFAFLLITIFMLVFVTQILQTNIRLFKALAKIPRQAIVIREKQLIRFKQCLQESVESIKFIRELNDFIGKNFEDDDRLNDKGFRFKEQEVKFSFSKAKKRLFLILTIATVLLTSIWGLFCASYVQALNSIESSRILQTGLSIAERMGYATPLISTNFIYWTTFYNQSNMLIRNLPPVAQLQQGLEDLSQVNNYLISAFSQQQGKYYVQDIENLLSNDICSYLPDDAGSQQYCQTATKGKVLGFAALNKQYYEFLSYYMEIFQEDPTNAKYERIIDIFLYLNTAPSATITFVYTYLRNFLLERLFTNIDNHGAIALILFILIWIACGVVAFITKVFILKKFKRFDIVRYNVLTLIPSDLMLQNKTIMFYLKKEFVKDLNEVRSIL